MTGTDLVSTQARVLARLVASAVLSHEERAAIMDAIRALEREARAKAYDQRDDQ